MLSERAQRERTGGAERTETTSRSRRRPPANEQDGSSRVQSLQETVGNRGVQELYRRGRLDAPGDGEQPVALPDRVRGRVETAGAERDGEGSEPAALGASGPTADGGPAPAAGPGRAGGGGTGGGEARPEAAPEGAAEPATEEAGSEAEAEAAQEPEAEPAAEGEAAAGEVAGAPTVPGAAVEDASPSSPEEDPEFQAVVEQVERVAAREQVHPPAEAASAEAQAAADGPPNEVERMAAANQVTEMAQVAETVEEGPPPFDKEAFKAELLRKVDAVYPDTLEDVEEFKDEDNLAPVKSDLAETVDQTKQQAEGPIKSKAEETPDTAGLESKPTKELEPPKPGTPPPGVGAARAAPKPKPEATVSTPFRERSESLEQQLAATGVPEETLANSGDPEFVAAVESKRAAQEHAAQAPTEYRQHEQSVLSSARAEAETEAETQTTTMHGDRSQLLTQVESLQERTSSADTQKRAEITARFQEIYDETNQRVEARLARLDENVNTTFDQGAEEAVRIFEDYVDQEMRAYKEERYSGVTGTFLQVTDWAEITTLPDEVERFYAEGRRRFLEKMNATVDRVASIVETGLTDAHDLVTEGRRRVEEARAALPASLQEIGAAAASDIQGQFDQLEQTVEAKKDQLITSLAQKYAERLEHVDSRIEELKAANRAWYEKAWDAVAGVAQTILRLRDMLLGVLSKAASAVTTIVRDPIGFLGNLVDGVAQGLNNFVEDIWTHLQTGLIEWLTGAVAEAGIQLPDTWDLAGIFSLVMQILGLTYENIRAQAVEVLGEETVSALEGTFEIFRVMLTEGIAGLWRYVQQKLGDLKAMVMDRIRDLIATQVIEAGIDWILGLLGPVGAFVKACRAIYDMVTFFVDRARQVFALVDAVLDSVLAIAQGNLAGAAALVEDALARSIPVLIGFLANLLGLGDLPDRIRGVVEAVQRPIDQAIQWVLEKAKEAVARLGGLLGFGGDEAKVPGTAEEEPAETAGTEDRLLLDTFSEAGEEHSIFVDLDGGAQVMVASGTPREVPPLLDHLESRVGDLSDPNDQKQATDHIAKARTVYSQIPVEQIKVQRRTPEGEVRTVSTTPSPPPSVQQAIAKSDALGHSLGVLFRLFHYGRELPAESKASMNMFVEITIAAGASDAPAGGSAIPPAPREGAPFSERGWREGHGGTVASREQTGGETRLTAQTWSMGEGERKEDYTTHAERHFVAWFRQQSWAENVTAIEIHNRPLSPCTHCADLLAGLLRDHPNIRTALLFWEEPYVQARIGTTQKTLKDLQAAGWVVHPGPGQIPK